MAVAPTGTIYKALKFDGVSSRTYGVYITGAAVYNAPKRDVEMIAIPGRNGSFALDKGRFENIEVTYPAGIFADAESDFAEAVSNFRNFLCSRNGYVRLQDEYNPNEYRMAVYKSGLEVEPALLRAGEFEIVFECKPQRYLTSGETAVTVTSGDEITNPTLFEASPLLKAWGYGNISLNDDQITIEHRDLGNILLYSNARFGKARYEFNSSILEAGDRIYFTYGQEPEIRFNVITASSRNIQSVSITNTANLTASYHGVGTSTEIVAKITTGEPFYFGTSKVTTASADVTLGLSGGVTTSFYFAYVVNYDGNNTIILNRNTLNVDNTKIVVDWETGSIFDIRAYSTQQAIQPQYIDLDIGEVYGYSGGEAVSMNNIVQLPSKLPTLAVGSTTIVMDNTISQLEIIPRWWKI